VRDMCVSGATDFYLWHDSLMFVCMASRSVLPHSFERVSRSVSMRRPISLKEKTLILCSNQTRQTYERCENRMRCCDVLLPGFWRLHSLFMTHAPCYVCVCVSFSLSLSLSLPVALSSYIRADLHRQQGASRPARNE